MKCGITLSPFLGHNHSRQTKVESPPEPIRLVQEISPPFVCVCVCVCVFAVRIHFHTQQRRSRQNFSVLVHEYFTSPQKSRCPHSPRRIIHTMCCQTWGFSAKDLSVRFNSPILPTGVTMMDQYQPYRDITRECVQPRCMVGRSAYQFAQSSWHAVSLWVCVSYIWVDTFTRG